MTTEFVSYVIDYKYMIAAYLLISAVFVGSEILARKYGWK